MSVVERRRLAGATQRVSVVVESDPLLVHPVDGAYVSTIWLPVLGPTATLMWPRLVASDGATLDLSTLGASLGVRSRDRVRSSVNRLVMFGHARVVDVDDEVARVVVFNAAPPLTSPQLDRLPPLLLPVERALRLLPLWRRVPVLPRD